MKVVDIDMLEMFAIKVKFSNVLFEISKERLYTFLNKTKKWFIGFWFRHLKYEEFLKLFNCRVKRKIYETLV